MSSSLRDTQFQGFAHAIFEELYHKDVIDTRTYLHYRKEIEQIIACRAYDLVGHTLAHAETIAFDRLSIGEHVERLIPDMIELPKEVKK